MMRTFPFLEKLQQGSQSLAIGGLWGSSRAYLLSLFRQHSNSSPYLVITASQKQAEELYEDLKFFSQMLTPYYGDREVFLYSQWDIAPYEEASPHREIVAERLSVLDKLLNHENIIVVASITAVMHRTLSRKALKEFTLYLGVGEELDREELLSMLVDTGYKHVALVEDRGEFSVRGGIIDLFPAFSGNPIRIEFFGDEVESVREFDPVTQRSLEQVELVNILPGREIVIGESTCAEGKKNIEASVAETGASFNTFTKVMTHIDEKLFFPGVEWYAAYLHGKLESIVEYVADDALLFLDEPDDLQQAAEAYMTLVRKNFQRMQAKGRLFPNPEQVFVSPGALRERLNAYRQVSLQLLDLGRGVGTSDGREHYDILTKSIDWAYTTAPNEKGVEDHGQHTASTTKRLREWLEDGYQVVVTVYTEAQAKRVWEILKDHQVPAHVATDPRSIKNDAVAHDVTVVVGTINCGFALPDHHLLVINEDEFLGKKTVRQRHKKPRRRSDDFLNTLNELEANDYIVHVDHGIGIYLGLQKVTVQDIAMECLQLEYTGGDKVYVPIDRLDLVQKYKGADQKKPKIDKLGGTRWARAKEKVKASVEKMAKALLELYAARQALPGATFSVEDHLYREFEASFEYEETPDQAKAIEAVLNDMMQTKPMDRLVCGDVGYGKTEVALRAAFLAVLNGKQVAILVPTTLLAQQHYDNFNHRFAAYPVNIGMLSRFKTKKEQHNVVKGIKDGTIDIVIGTHRLLQKDIGFKELGLVIIDEEQRFGVSHKEKLRQLRVMVDVLTLTATPIPRTLHMSLMGVRDLSVIETPPEGRLSIRTYVTRFDEGLIYEAISRELERGGQVFFVHNRVDTIDGIALRLSRLIPHARIVVGHGKMKEHELEDVMFKFVNKEADVLVSTTIIESGLDMPSVNTMIINRAHTFGLSQLYQLRGRIGRSKTRGFAYLLVPDEKILSSDAKKRLRAIQDLTDVGAGFRLAAHDLEIRGAGNLLGAAQSGHIAALGFDLYCKTIQDTVREMKGEPPDNDEFHPQIKMKVSAHFPEDYIPDMKQRLDMYKRLMSARDFGKLLDVEEEIEDRYGRLPEPARNIVGLAELNLFGTQLRVSQILAIEDMVKIILDAHSPVTEVQVKKVIKDAQGTIKPTVSAPGMVLDVKGMGATEKLEHVRKTLQSLQ